MRNEAEYEISVHGVCFADWLNKIDATITYDVRRQWAVWAWRNRYDLGQSGIEAIAYFCGAVA